jgi:hypothetical protein
MNAASPGTGLAHGELVDQRAGVQSLDVLERRDHDHRRVPDREELLLTCSSTW